MNREKNGAHNYETIGDGRIIRPKILVSRQIQDEPRRRRETLGRHYQCHFLCLTPIVDPHRPRNEKKD